MRDDEYTITLMRHFGVESNFALKTSEVLENPNLTRIFISFSDGFNWEDKFECNIKQVSPLAVGIALQRAIEKHDEVVRIRKCQ